MKKRLISFHNSMYRAMDTNCNGIYGVNSSSGLSWEEELCGDSSPMGVIYLGTKIRKSN
jgi:hypothetical protein